jgi:putative membrane protein
MMMYGWDGWGWGGWILMALVMIAFWALLITAVVLGVRYVAGGAGQRNPSLSQTNRAEDVLAERFARGDIDEEEFRRRMTALREHR